MDIDKLIQETQKIKLKKDLLLDTVNRYTDIIIIGNGGSNSVASHIAQDYTKELDKRQQKTLKLSNL